MFLYTQNLIVRLHKTADFLKLVFNLNHFAIKYKMIVGIFNILDAVTPLRVKRYSVCNAIININIDLVLIDQQSV
jgi:hypothetical protein